MAEGHVRDAQSTDADEIGRIQSSTWQQAYRRQLPAEALDAMTAEAAAEGWRAAITHPPDAAHHVFVALEASTTDTTRVGFAAIAAPAEDEEEASDAVEIVALLVEPRWGRRGHGSRLLSAAVEGARADGASSMICWVLAGDRATEGFLRSAGWERDGWRRTFDAGEREIAQHRMSTDISHLPRGATSA
ncbi:GNAT family N-acetyltransferase [Blastococcus sp. Marseille-P5729]|uniref:GNAT family N-acetyltransferase n=1 Tax=Blastococcus sp. Marseille-P5729 TaxID=2086582 RepID=UPI000D100C4A|nr:GNAT family N-acetyltransferase [Blastococcus sp. Marseille-P5729]